MKSILDEIAIDVGASHAGWTRLEKPLSFEFYREWLQRGFHGEMSYLERQLPDRENPQQRYPRIRGVFVFAFPYLPHPEPIETPLKTARIATYARGRDYHHWLKGKLSKAAQTLATIHPSEDFEIHTDTGPLPERDLATRAGLGWIGKNTCVIDRQHGSFFLLGEILSSLDLEPRADLAPIPDFCGTCRRCIDACPTGAIVEPRVLDARRCISYLSIESRAIPPEELRKPWGDWLFGCDICQTVCPWNQKPFRPNEGDKQAILPMSGDEELKLIEELRWILSSSGHSIDKTLRRTAMARAGSFGLKRNALIVAANRKLTALRPEITTLCGHPRLGELARWTLEKI